MTWRRSLSKALVEKILQGWNSLLRVDLAIFQRRLSLCVAILTKLFQQLTECNQLSLFLGQHGFIFFFNVSWLILKKSGFTLVLANYKKGIFPLKRAFFGESQRPVRRLTNQISSFRLETHWSFLTYVQLTYMLHYRIYGFCFSFERAGRKIRDFASIWKAALVPFAPSNCTSVLSKRFRIIQVIPVISKSINKSK